MSKEAVEHKEWRKENSLTAPSDRDPSKKFRLNEGAPPLTDKQTEEAVKELSITSFVERFPEVERRYADPPIHLQRIGLVSFVPAKGAKPNHKGIYGFAKLRGNYPTEIEAQGKAQELIRTVDSYHQVYHTYVGRPFPLTVSSDYSAEVDRVDMRKDTKESISHDVKKKREKEEQDIQDIKRREQLLLDESKREEDDPTLLEDNYITLRVKKAQLSWTYLETEKKLDEMKNIIIKTRKEIKEMDKKNPEYKKMYFKKYMDARENAGLSVNEHGDNWIKFMVEDAELGF